MTADIDLTTRRRDLEARLLRHVSAFERCRLRVLRVALCRRYAHLSFRIADETLALMRENDTAGELEHLTPGTGMERTENALTTRNPQVLLRYCATAAPCASVSGKSTPCLAYRAGKVASGN